LQSVQLFFGQALVDRRHATKVFAIAGLDIGAIGSKTLISFSSGLTLIIKRQMVSSTKIINWAFVPGRTFNKCPAIANTDSLVARLTDSVTKHDLRFLRRQD